jgi:hypothetical protein
MKHLSFILIVLLFTSCSKYSKIDRHINKMTPPITVISKSIPQKSGGTIIVKLMDSRGDTYTSRDNSLQTAEVGDIIIQKFKSSKIDRQLNKMKPPVVIISTNGDYFKVVDKKGKITTIYDPTLESLSIGDTIRK